MSLTENSRKSTSSFSSLRKERLTFGHAITREQLADEPEELEGGIHLAVAGIGKLFDLDLVQQKRQPCRVACDGVFNGRKGEKRDPRKLWQPGRRGCGARFTRRG